MLFGFSVDNWVVTMIPIHCGRKFWVTLTYVLKERKLGTSSYSRRPSRHLQLFYASIRVVVVPASAPFHIFGEHPNSSRCLGLPYESGEHPSSSNPDLGTQFLSSTKPSVVHGLVLGSVFSIFSMVESLLLEFW